jgi:hypothetical protein
MKVSSLQVVVLILPSMLCLYIDIAVSSLVFQTQDTNNSAPRDMFLDLDMYTLITPNPLGILVLPSASPLPSHPDPYRSRIPT